MRPVVASQIVEIPHGVTEVLCYGTAVTLPRVTG